MYKCIEASLFREKAMTYCAMAAHVTARALLRLVLLHWLNNDFKKHPGV
jgi:hypothetical protein